MCRMVPPSKKLPALKTLPHSSPYKPVTMLSIRTQSEPLRSPHLGAGSAHEQQGKLRPKFSAQQLLPGRAGSVLLVILGRVDILTWSFTLAMSLSIPHQWCTLLAMLPGGLFSRLVEAVSPCGLQLPCRKRPHVAFVRLDLGFSKMDSITGAFHSLFNFCNRASRFSLQDSRGQCGRGDSYYAVSHIIIHKCS